MGFLTGLLVNKVIGPVIRHGATVAGTWLVVEGYADEETATTITGGIVAAGSVVASFAEKTLRDVL